jgi:hypothetical protein
MGCPAQFPGGGCPHPRDGDRTQVGPVAPQRQSKVAVEPEEWTGIDDSQVEVEVVDQGEQVPGGAVGNLGSTDGNAGDDQV